MGRSVVIMASDIPSNKMACGNILPDKMMTKLVNIKKTPRFSTYEMYRFKNESICINVSVYFRTVFMSALREKLKVEKWLLYADPDLTNNMYNDTCVQVTLILRGLKNNI